MSKQWKPFNGECTYCGEHPVEVCTIEVLKENAPNCIQSILDSVASDAPIVFLKGHSGQIIAAFKRSEFIGIYYQAPDDLRERTTAAIEKMASQTEDGEDWKS